MAGFLNTVVVIGFACAVAQAQFMMPGMSQGMPQGLAGMGGMSSMGGMGGMSSMGGMGPFGGMGGMPGAGGMGSMGGLGAMALLGGDIDPRMIPFLGGMGGSMNGMMNNPFFLMSLMN